MAPDVMGKLHDLLDREVDRHDREWMDTMQRLTVTEKTEKRPVSIRSRGVERDCRSIVNQLVSSMPKEFLLRTSFTEHRALTQAQAMKKSGTSRDPASREKYISRMQEKSTSRTTLVHPETRQCPGSRKHSSPSRTTCPGSRIQNNLGTEFCPGSRIRNILGTEFCLGSRGTSKTDRNMTMKSHLARVMTRGPSTGTTHLRPLPILMYRRLLFIPCWWTGNSAGWTEKCFRI